MRRRINLISIFTEKSVSSLHRFGNTFNFVLFDDVPWPPRSHPMSTPRRETATARGSPCRSDPPGGSVRCARLPVERACRLQCMNQSPRAPILPPRFLRRCNVPTARRHPFSTWSRDRRCRRHSCVRKRRINLINKTNYNREHHATVQGITVRITR